MKLCFLDVETTGTSPGFGNQLWQLAAIFDEDGEFKGRFNMKARPTRDCVWDPEAMKMAAYTQEQINNFGDTQQDIYDMFSTWLAQRVDKFDKDDKMFFIAYNANFDHRFIRALFKDHKDNYMGSYFWWPYIDMMTIMMWAVADKRHLLPNFKLDTVCKHCGIVPNKESLHDAMYDVRLVRQLYYYLEK